MGGSHGAQLIGGAQYGAGGDPVVVIANTNNCEIGGLLTDGTVGVSVGEGTVVNNTYITSDIRNMSACPITFNKGTGLFFYGSATGEPTLASYVGSWTGPGEPKPVIMVFPGANDITYAPTAVQGWFTHDVVDRSGVMGRLRVARSGAAPAAPIIARDDKYMHKFSRVNTGAPCLRMLNDTDNTGHSGSGELSLPGSGASFNSWVLAPSMTDMTDFDIEGTDLASVRGKYAVVVHLKYVPGILGNRIGFSLQDGGGATARAPEIFYGSVLGDSAAPSPNTIGYLLHPLKDGEWIPLVIPLKNIIYTGSVPSALTRFLVWKMDNAATYDLTITKPVLVYIGTPERA